MNGPAENSQTAQKTTLTPAVVKDASSTAPETFNVENQKSSDWLRHLFACNPFYLISVALLLFGCYRISMEPALFNHEAAHLFFNFTSLQVYEALLVATSIFLARRRIWSSVMTFNCRSNS